MTLSLLANEIVKFISCGPVAQLDRANGYEPLGREFESLRAHHIRSFSANVSQYLKLFGGIWALTYQPTCGTGMWLFTGNKAYQTSLEQKTDRISIKCTRMGQRPRRP